MSPCRLRFALVMCESPLLALAARPGGFPEAIRGLRWVPPGRRHHEYAHQQTEQDLEDDEQY
jgi:hypothetical protein